MIALHPYNDHAAAAIFAQLDPFDQIEANVIQGEIVSHLAMFAQWRAMRPTWIAGHILATDGAPNLADQAFAVMALGNTGQCGVAQGAFLSRNHTKFKKPLVAAARAMAINIPLLCEQHGIHRIEARCYAGHPTASTFLQLIGFQHETDMPGFGSDGSATFRQFSFVPVRGRV